VLSSSADTATAAVFLDIRGVVNSTGWEEGLLGLAFHPQYAKNGYLFVNYTASPPRRTVVARYRVSASDPNKADPQSESMLLEIAQPYENHNGGQLAFGPDGYLYIAVGDGGGGGDPHGNGQNLATLLGSMLRIDVDATAGGAKYGIPPDNPFASGTAGERPEIWAYGLRNPWRFSFDPVTQELWAGDVGQDKWEEIDIISKGKNYGWNVMEGTHCHNPPQGCPQAGLELPLHEYGQSGGQSVTGGHVYRGQRLPQLRGAYVFADFIGGRIWRLDRDAQGKAAVSLLAESQLQISSFGVDRDGELYLCAFDGRLYRFE
jgi:glucose/arabinose dehydrogenase